MSAVSEAPTSALLESALAQVAKLSPEERIWLMQRMETEAAENDSVPDWHLAELKGRERLAAEQGDAAYISWEQAKQDLRKDLGLE